MQQDVVGKHLLDERAGFRPLPRVEEADPGVFVGPVHAARNLPEGPADKAEDVIRRVKRLPVAREHPPFGRFAKPLGDVHDVPVGQLRRPGPVGRIAVDLAGQSGKRFVARAVVEPRQRPHHVAAAAVVPVVFQKQFVRAGCEPLVIVRQKRDDALIARIVVVVLHDPADHHVRQQVAAAPLVLEDGSEPAVGRCVERMPSIHPRAFSVIARSPRIQAVAAYPRSQ